MNKILNDSRSRVDEARRTWGTIFSNIRIACEQWNSAWYHVEDKQAWIEEEERRLYGLEKEMQKARDTLALRRGTK